MRQIANNVYIPVLKDLVEEGKEVSMMISGSSMNPFLIHQRDYILMKKPEEELKAGDMVFFQRRDEAYVMHRIHHINKEGKLFIIGDAQVDMEGPIDKEQVFAIITKVKRKGKWIAPGDFWWEFFEHIWLHLIPFSEIFDEIIRNSKIKGGNILRITILFLLSDIDFFPNL